MKTIDIRGDAIESLLKYDETRDREEQFQSRLERGLIHPISFNQLEDYRCTIQHRMDESESSETAIIESSILESILNAVWKCYFESRWSIGMTFGHFVGVTVKHAFFDSVSCGVQCAQCRRVHAEFD